MITLITYPAGFGQPAFSPFCVKAMALLNMAGVMWQREDTNDPRKMTYRKLPAIRDSGTVIADSDNIRAHLEAQGTDFDAGLTDTQKAHSRALIRMAEEHLYFHLVLDRWGNDTVWPILQDAYFHEIPKVLRGFITGRLRASLMKGMQAQGLGRFNEAERLERAEPDLRAIATLVGDNFLFGDRPSAADASVAAVLAGIIATPVPTPLHQRVADDPVLAKYVERMEPVWSKP
jgi:glutathione S-transferase